MQYAQLGATLVFCGAGFMTTYALIKTVQDQLDAVAELIASLNVRPGYDFTIDNDLLTFETVTCGGCGQAVKTGPDGFTPIEHECFIETASGKFFSVNRDNFVDSYARAVQNQFANSAPLNGDK